MLFRYLPIALLFPAFTLPAQTNQAVILDNNILTVQLHLAGAPLTQPIVELNTGPGSLVLEFDHYGTDIKDYLYTIQHCNSDWQPSDLNDNEYIDGFTEDRITDFSNSFNTLANYTHYRLGLPNRNMRWTKSGNYLLKIFDNDNDRRLVIVRRFMVVEPQWFVEAQFVRTAQVQYMNTHHEIDFTVLHRNARVQNPINDVKAFVLQNGRWDNAIGPVSTNFTRAGEQLVFDYQDKIVFPAGKEWRFFDMRSFDYRGEQVRRIDEKDDYYEVTLQPDESRFGQPYIFRGDINGRYSIENTNFNQTLDQCDYAKVLFSIQRNLPEDEADVYIFGDLSDWQIKPEFKMAYEAEAKVYYAEAFLKQGYYNYIYAVVDRATGKIDEDGYEGNWFETGNLYTILVYYRPFGARFDRLMAAASLDSRQRN